MYNGTSNQHIYFKIRNLWLKEAATNTSIKTGFRLARLVPLSPKEDINRSNCKDCDM